VSAVGLARFAWFPNSNATAKPICTFTVFTTPSGYASKILFIFFVYLKVALGWPSETKGGDGRVD
jgi:hypothetical protein